MLGLIPYNTIISTTYEDKKHQKFGERDFCFVGPPDWNTPGTAYHRMDLHFITGTVVFKRKLKTELFTQAFGH